MNVVDIIAKKRDGGALSADEIGFVVQGVTDGSLPDYQVSAWLMAVFLRGMSNEETLALTLAMRDSGQRIDLSDLPNGPTLDKHSTGGVGDKTTLVVVPLLAACGVPMLKMSGRGLGFSGGTIDKLEAIPGFRTDLSIEQAKTQVQRIGAALIGQSETLAPADRALYALRDVTATVESVPLIAGSIMSKKLASGGQRIVLDVKVGRGAFMKNLEQARILARELVQLGNSVGVPTSALLTRMDEPLGWTVGNALEVREAIQVLQNAPYMEPRFRALCLGLAAHGLVAVGKTSDAQKGREMAENALLSGQGVAKFVEIVHAQNGPSTTEAILASLPIAPMQHVVRSSKVGFVHDLNAETIGKLTVELGAGRRSKGEAINPAVGIELHKKIGSQVQENEPLATLHLASVNTACAEDLGAILYSVFVIEKANLEHPTPDASLVLEVI